MLSAGVGIIYARTIQHELVDVLHCHLRLHSPKQ